MSHGGPRLPWDAINPYPYYQRRRQDGDVVWDDAVGAWLILGYHTAQAVLGQPGWTIDPLASPSLRTKRDSINPEMFSRSMLNNDGAAHRRLRSATRDVFAPSSIAGLRDGIEAIARALIDHPPAGTTIDFMSEVAQPLTLAVLGEWLGLDAESSRLLSAKVQEISPMVRPLPTVAEFEAGTAASARIVAHLLPLAAHRRSAPGDDLLSFLAADPDLSLDDVVVNTVNIAVGALENTADFLGSAIVRLLKPEHAGARLIDEVEVSDPGLITELFRLDTPQAISRTATEPQRIGDAEIEPGQQVLVVLAAANRDPEVYEDPDRCRPGRSAPAPLTFGYGEHFCIGRGLARLQTQIVLQRMAARDPILTGPVTWRDTPSRRGPLTVPLAFRVDLDRVMADKEAVAWPTS